VDNLIERAQDILERFTFEEPAIIGDPSPAELAAMIDHTLLKADASHQQIEKLCEEAAAHRFACVCVNPTYVSRCAGLLRSSAINVCTVVGFPLGATTSAVKIVEAEQALADGAREMDMVISLGALKSGDFDTVERDIQGVTSVCRRTNAVLKVIIETALLTEEEKIIACILAQRAGADFVKTSTGFSTTGATARDIALMRLIVGSSLGVKASDGIRTRTDALRMIASGATRLGTSTGVQILKSDSEAARLELRTT
jgi:deoxyribose-phosphate aldolase